MTSLPLSTGKANADFIPACWAADWRVKFGSFATSLTQIGRALATTLAEQIRCYGKFASLRNCAECIETSLLVGTPDGRRGQMLLTSGGYSRHAPAANR